MKYGRKSAVKSNGDISDIAPKTKEEQYSGESAITINGEFVRAISHNFHKLCILSRPNSFNKLNS